jgi:hypothetical protein
MSRGSPPEIAACTDDRDCSRTAGVACFGAGAGAGTCAWTGAGANVDAGAFADDSPESAKAAAGAAEVPSDDGRANQTPWYEPAINPRLPAGSGESATSGE